MDSGTEILRCNRGTSNSEIPTPDPSAPRTRGNACRLANHACMESRHSTGSGATPSCSAEHHTWGAAWLSSQTASLSPASSLARNWTYCGVRSVLMRVRHWNVRTRCAPMKRLGLEDKPFKARLVAEGKPRGMIGNPIAENRFGHAFPTEVKPRLAKVSQPGALRPTSSTTP